MGGSGKLNTRSGRVYGEKPEPCDDLGTEKQNKGRIALGGSSRKRRQISRLQKNPKLGKKERREVGEGAKKKE